jgi:hypothetical protein
VLGSQDWAGWAQVGMATLGIGGAAIAATWLCDDKFISGTTAEVRQAGVIGLQLPFFAVAMFISLLIALHATEPVI